MAKQQRTLGKAQAMEAARMYEEVDGRGRRVWSVMRLAEHFYVSETTMYRAVNRLGSYKDLPAPLPPEGTPEAKAEALASWNRLNSLLQQEEPPRIKVEDLFQEPVVLTKPLSPEEIKKADEEREKKRKAAEAEFQARIAEAERLQKSGKKKSVVRNPLDE